MYRDLILFNHLLLVIVSLFPIQSDATSVVHIFRQLAAESRSWPKPQIILQMPSSPSPSPAPMDLPNKEPGVTESNTEPVVTETCDRISKTCHLDSLTGCLGLERSLLLVLNDADSALKVNITILPVNITYKEIDIPKHQAKKIDISDSVRGSSSIVLDTGNGHCIIYMGVIVPKDNINLQFPSIDTYITPVHGAYILFASALIIGGTWTCFKYGKRSPDGAYQELEMGPSDLVSSVNVETTESWDQVWDDDWDEEKGVKSGARNPVKSSIGNGSDSKSSNLYGWGNDWDD